MQADLQLLQEFFGSGLAFWFIALAALVLFLSFLEGVVQSYVLDIAYDWSASLASVADAVCRTLVDIPGMAIAAPILEWIYTHRIYNPDLSLPTVIFLLIVGQDFCFYWYHRAAHRMRWFWATHSAHHSPNQLVLSVSLRFDWTGKLTGTPYFYIPLIFIGFSPVAVASAIAFNLLYQFWLHAPWIPRLGPLEWFLVTPTHHKVHHASNAEYLDCNYGGVFIIFDRMFGTFVEERADVNIRYGLVKPLYSYNPWTITTHEWIRLWHDFRQSKGWQKKLAVVWGPPERPIEFSRVNNR